MAWLANIECHWILLDFFFLSLSCVPFSPWASWDCHVLDYFTLYLFFTSWGWIHNRGGKLRVLLMLSYGFSWTFDRLKLVIQKWLISSWFKMLREFYILSTVYLRFNHISLVCHYLHLLRLALTLNSRNRWIVFIINVDTLFSSRSVERFSFTLTAYTRTHIIQMALIFSYSIFP